MDAFYSMVRFFVTGGPFMYPILIVFAVGGFREGTRDDRQG
jgi:hypothetical protein